MVVGACLVEGVARVKRVACEQQLLRAVGGLVGDMDQDILGSGGKTAPWDTLTSLFAPEQGNNKWISPPKQLIKCS